MTRLVVTTLRTRALPWFGLAAALFILGFAAFSGAGQGAVEAAAMFVFLGACIRSIGLAVRDNPVSAQMLARRDVIHGALLAESGRTPRRKPEPKGDAAAPDPSRPAA